jgi:transposase
VARLRKRYAKGTLTKADINKRGYNKFLSVSSGVTVSVDEEKVKQDAIWDGLKGYKTNTDLSPEEVYEAYRNLWNVERSFRITKGTLDVRPMFHFTPRRIEAHVCICFVALKVYKGLERLLKLSGCQYSVDEVLRYDNQMDFVIGNPPYVRVHNLDDSYDSVKSFSFANGGMTDLYLVFFEKGFQMLKPGGKLCYITPQFLA